MNKNKSDQLVREKLNQLHVEYKPQHWGLFEEMLTQQEAGMPVVEDRRLDELVFEKMHQLKAGDRAAHWDLLAARLAEQTHVSHKLVLYKLMEASLLLLLLFIVAQSFPLNPSDSDAPESPIVEQKTIAPSIQNTNNEPLLSDQSAQNTPKNKGLTTNPPKNLQVTIDITQLRALEKTASATALESETFPENLMDHAFSTSPTLPQSNLKTPASKTEKLSLQKTPAEADRTPPVVHTRIELMNALEQIMLAELEYKGQSGYVALLSPFKQRAGWVVSMFGSGDYNQIITPRGVEGDKVYDKLLRYAPGYSGGITAGRELGRWEIGGGAIYSAKKYEPRPVVHVGGSFFNGGYDGEGLRSIELNMVQLPLYFRYNFVYHNKWRAYATLGFSLQVNFQTNYYFADEVAFGLPQPLSPSSREYVPEYKENLPGGWLDGGTLWENGYISGNASLGLERYITGRWSIFAQPTYHHSLNYFTEGVGPDKDRINTMSIFTGVRVRLNN